MNTSECSHEHQFKHHLEDFELLCTRLVLCFGGPAKLGLEAENRVQK